MYCYDCEVSIRKDINFDNLERWCKDRCNELGHDISDFTHEYMSYYTLYESLFDTEYILCNHRVYALDWKNKMKGIVVDNIAMKDCTVQHCIYGDDNHKECIHVVYCKHSDGKFLMRLACETPIEGKKKLIDVAYEAIDYSLILDEV